MACTPQKLQRKGQPRVGVTSWDGTIIYEAHVRGFTKLHPGVPEKQRGTYAGFTKDAVRSLSRRLGLRTWDKPAAACVYLWARDTRLCDGPALAGVEAIPGRWLAQLEMRSTIESVADDLAAFPEWRLRGPANTEECAFYATRYPVS